MAEARLLQGTRRTAQRDRGRHQEGLPPPGDEIPPGPQSRTIRRREEHFKEAKEAYEVLSDAAQARHLRPARSRRASRPQRGGGGGGFGAEAFSDIFGDVFGDIFGGARRGGALAGVPRRRPALRAGTGSARRPCSATTVEIDVAEAVRVRDLPRAAARPRAARPVTCETCGGAGQVRVSQGFFQLQQTCPRCRGTGTHRAQSLRHLPGPGPGAPHKKLVGEDPAGVDTGDRVRLTGEGEAGRNGGPAGRPVRRGAACASTRSSSATASTSAARCRSALPPPRWRHGRGADARGRGDAEDSRRDAVRARVPAARQGRASRCAAARAGDLFCRVVVETPVQPVGRAARAAAQARGVAASRTASGTRRARRASSRA